MTIQLKRAVTSVFLNFLPVLTPLAQAEIPRHYSVQKVREPAVLTQPQGVDADEVTLGDEGQVAGYGYQYDNSTGFYHVLASYASGPLGFPRSLYIDNSRFFVPYSINASGMIGGVATPEFEQTAFRASPWVAIPHGRGYRFVGPLAQPNVPGTINALLETSGITRFGGVAATVQYSIAGPEGGYHNSAIWWPTPNSTPRIIPGTENRCANVTAINERGDVLGELSPGTYAAIQGCDFTGNWTTKLIRNGQALDLPTPAGVNAAPWWDTLSDDGTVGGRAWIGNEEGYAVYRNGQSRFIRYASQIHYQNYFTRAGLSSDGIAVVRAYNNIPGIPSSEVTSSFYLLDIRRGIAKDIRELIDDQFDDHLFPVQINNNNQLLVRGTYRGQYGVFLLTPRR